MTKTAEVFNALNTIGSRHIISDTCTQLQAVLDEPTVWVFMPNYGVVLKDGGAPCRVIGLGDTLSPNCSEIDSFLLSLKSTQRLYAFMNIGDHLKDEWLIPLARFEPKPVIPRIEKRLVHDSEGNAISGAMAITLPDCEMVIHDPYASPCLRFAAHPNQYGLSEVQGQLMVKHNTGLGMALTTFSVELYKPCFSPKKINSINNRGRYD